MAGAQPLLPFTIFHLPFTIPLMPITPEDVKNVAKLARLELPQERVSRLTHQLESILEYVAKIGQVDVSTVEPMAHALPLQNVFREDIVEPSLPLEKVLQNAPETDGPFFKVPKVIGGDEDSAG
jgi:aspartyl-tRNA(Asn)/glutamyl-tRNA(Gln) amidotransferase subunit C